MAGSSGFGWWYFTDLLQMTEYLACRKQTPQNSITLRAPSYDASAGVGLYPLLPLKPLFNRHLPLFMLSEEKYKI